MKHSTKPEHLEMLKFPSDLVSYKARANSIFILLKMESACEGNPCPVHQNGILIAFIKLISPISV